MGFDGAMKHRLALFLLFAVFALPAWSQRVDDGPLVVATYAYPQRDRVAAISPLADYLAGRSGRPVDVLLLPSPSALVEAMRKGDVDVAVPNLHGYLQARQWRERIEPLPVPDVPQAQAARYRAVLVARGPASVEELKRAAGRLRLVLVGEDSASGGFVPVRYLREQGMAPETAFAGVAYAGSHAAALQAVAEGRADVAALAADVFDAAPPAAVAVLWRSAPIPPGPLLCRTTAAVACADIRGWLLEAHLRAPDVMAALRAGWPEFGDAMRFVAPPVMPD